MRFSSVPSHQSPVLNIVAKAKRQALIIEELEETNKGQRKGKGKRKGTTSTPMEEMRSDIAWLKKKDEEKTGEIERQAREIEQQAREIEQQAREIKQLMKKDGEKATEMTEMQLPHIGDVDALDRIRRRVLLGLGRDHLTKDCGFAG
ncbi:hypothetical protein K439DRAFT_1630716 [Ramaria rubella]|nr:hypothetical protein K439DRAFT_1630716 [Ramaria rubella]